MDAVTLPFEAIIAALFALAILARLAWDRGCRCEKCAFHQNELRMKRLKEKEDQHDLSHRNWDTCGDKACARNGERKRRMDS